MCGRRLGVHASLRSSVHHCLVGLVLVVAASATTNNDTVTDLTAVTFDRTVRRGTWFIAFILETCQHCKELAPFWKQLGQEAALEKWPVQIARLDCTRYRILCLRMRVLSFPAIVLMTNGQLRGLFKGAMSVPHLKAWLAEHHVQVSPLLMEAQEYSTMASGGWVGGWSRLHSPSHSLVATVSVGTPPQKMRCLLDSTTSDMWFASQRCQSHSCDQKAAFRRNQSATFSPELVKTPFGTKPRPVSAAYRFGSIMGFFVQDTVVFGSARLLNQSFIVAEDETLLPHPSWDGICGLGWESLGKTEHPMYKSFQEQGRRAVFTIIPGRSADGGAYMVLGEVPPAAMQPGTLVWVDAEPLEAAPYLPGGGFKERAFWIAAGGISLHRPIVMSARFLLDTSTAEMILVPEKHFVSFILSLIPRQIFAYYCDSLAGGLVTCECSIAQDPSMLPLEIHLGARVFKVPASELFVQMQAGDVSEEHLCRLQVAPSSHTSDIYEVPSEPFLTPKAWLPYRAFPHTKQATPATSTTFPPVTFAASQPVTSTTYPAGMATSSPPVISTRAPQETSPTLPGQTEVMFRKRRRRLLWEPRPASIGMRVPAATPHQSDELWVLGGPFLERLVTVFDFDEARLGFALPPSLSTPLLEKFEPADKVAPQNSTLLRRVQGTEVWCAAAAALFVILVSLFAIRVAKASVAARRHRLPADDPPDYEAEQDHTRQHELEPI